MKKATSQHALAGILSAGLLVSFDVGLVTALSAGTTTETDLKRFLDVFESTEETNLDRAERYGGDIGEVS